MSKKKEFLDKMDFNSLDNFWDDNSDDPRYPEWYIRGALIWQWIEDNFVEKEKDGDKSNFVVCLVCKGNPVIQGYDDEGNECVYPCSNCGDTGIMTLKEATFYENEMKKISDSEKIDPNELPF